MLRSRRTIHRGESDPENSAHVLDQRSSDLRAHRVVPPLCEK